MKHSSGCLVMAALALAIWCSSATAQIGGTSGGSSGTSSGNTGVGPSSSGGGLGATSSSGSSGGGGTGNSFLGASGTTGSSQFLSNGAGQGQLGQVARAGNNIATSNGDLLARFYVNPIAIGLPTSSSTTATIPAFGTPLFASLYPGAQTTSPFSTATTTATVGGIGGASRTTGIGLSGVGFTPANVTGFRPPAAYTTGIAFKYRPTPPSQVLTNLQQILARSTDLTERDKIKLVLDGSTVVLRGTVTDPDQRRLAGNLLRLSPGVKAVRNELAVQTVSAAQPTP